MMQQDLSDLLYVGFHECFGFDDIFSVEKNCIIKNCKSNIYFYSLSLF